MGKEKIFYYTIALNWELHPRMIVDLLTMSGDFRRTLLSVKDNQRSDHAYGATYMVGVTAEESEAVSLLTEASYMIVKPDQVVPEHRKQWLLRVDMWLRKQRGEEDD